MKDWTKRLHCTSLVHCDFCLGNVAWHNALSGRLTMPKFGSCPHGETLAAAKARRADLLVERVAAGLLTAEHATELATKLELSLEGV